MGVIVIHTKRAKHREALLRDGSGVRVVDVDGRDMRAVPGQPEGDRAANTLSRSFLTWDECAVCGSNPDRQHSRA